MNTKAGAATLLLVYGLTACGGAGGGATPSASPTAQRPTSTGTIRILQPSPGEVVDGTTLTVKVKVDGATVLTSGEASKDIRPDTGHVHLALDGQTVTLLAGLEYELTDLTPGQHILQAEFAAADHGYFDPRVLATTTFTVT